MVSGYMYVQFPLSQLPSPLQRPSSLSTFLRKFSQTTTDMPQWALRFLTARHMVMTSTLHTQLTSTQAALATEQYHSARQRDVLEKATEQLARETYGRRAGG